MGEADRQGFQRPAAGCRDDLAVDGIAALAVEALAGLQVALRDRDASPLPVPALPVGSPRRAALRTEIESSRPIKWKGLYMAAYRPLSWSAARIA